MNDEIQILYFKVTDIWKRFCEEHNVLFDLTCEEYTNLLNNKVDRVEETLDEKVKVIERINALESLRSEVIEEIKNSNYGLNDINNVSTLLDFFKAHEIALGINHLESFNNLLIEIIQKIQEQNKKNQLYIRKSLKHLKEIREAAVGAKSYDTYNARGNITNKNT